MARENLALLHGQLRETPRIYINNDGEEIKAMFIMRVIRRPMTNIDTPSKLFIDCPVILTRNKDIIKIIRTFEKGDLVDIRGVVSSKEVVKSTICPKCKHQNKSNGNILYITPIYICKRENASESEGLEILKSRSEISNLINVIGNLCREPEYYKDEKNRSYAQYQLAVNRRYRIRTDADDIKTDYPWVKTFGQQAYNDSTCLHTGSSVYISGALQTREIERATNCEECGEEYTWNDSAAEIVPYYTGYLANCDVPEKEDGGESSEEAKLGAEQAEQKE